MTEPETFEIVGTVVSRQEKVTKKGKPFYRLGLQESTGDPHDWTWWGEDAKTVAIGHTYRWKIKREPMADGRGKYRTIEEMLGEAVMDVPAPADNISQFPSSGASYPDPVRSSIEAQVALKAAVDLIVADKANYSELLTYGETYARWLLDIAASDGGSREPDPAPVRQRPASARSDPGEPPPATPPDEWPEDKPDYGNGPPAFAPPLQGPVGQANPVCLCGAEKPWNPQHQGWFCPNQKKSRDPAVQAQQKAEHPPTWP